jgi:hypothetical protein
MGNNQSNTSSIRTSKDMTMAMPAPSGSGALLACKVPVKRPLPCSVIVIHGVNDDGQAFPVIDEFICKGLNERLGRDDLFPHNWGPTVGTESTVQELSRAVTIQYEGRSPVIPFHWGYHPVDRATYQQDQQRYEAQLASHNGNPDLPYTTYYQDLRDKAEAGYGCRDNLGNWLNDQFTKDGGPFANATTNLVDMWGPGPGGPFFLGAALYTRTLTDKTAPMYPNPHRIYYVHAAERLAALVRTLRGTPDTENDAINVIAHSQGTEITMLANFLLVQSGQRPVDCVIMCDSPYAVVLPGLEETYAGYHQTVAARTKTLTNFANLMLKGRNRIDETRMLCTGVAKPDVWRKDGHGRDNFGKVYNYFCPQDQVVSMHNILGIGWQGIPDDVLKDLGDNFHQRAFSDGYRVGGDPGTFRMSNGNTATSSKCENFGSRSRTINAPKLPTPFTFRTLTGKDPLGEHLAGTALAADGAQKLRVTIDAETGQETTEFAAPASIGSGTLDRAQLQSLQASLQQRGYQSQLLSASYANVAGRALYFAERFETRAEGLARNEKRLSDWSQHSAIPLSHDAIQKCMAYDLAIGLNVSFEKEDHWWGLLYRADWRHPKNPDSEAKTYYKSGILPPLTKRQMNRPSLPKGIVNEYKIPEGEPAGGLMSQWPRPLPNPKG